ncbi:MAG: PP2C family protein-serine/threonine phosphatase [Planctomycetota bacterium]
MTDSGPFTSDFRTGFAQETDRLLRRRFLWLIGLLFTLSLLGLTALAFQLGNLDSTPLRTIPLAGVVGVAYTLTYLGAGLYAFFDRPSGQTLLRLTLLVIVVDGLLNLLWRVLELPGGAGMFGFMISHVLACLFLPWTPRQALRPAVLILSLSAASHLLIEGDTLIRNPEDVLGDDLVPILLSVFVPLPGVFVCWLRDSRRMERYKLRFLQQRYGEVRRELTDARRIHESLFPSPIDQGSVRFRYQYEPMRQIGGDFLFSHRSEPVSGGEGDLSIVLIDVTGHGIPAALTVNRLHGELERVFAEDPRIGPGEVLRLLNRYVHLTLATHSVFVTAICARVNAESGEVEYANGGHPPAFLRAVDGTIDRLESTAFVLGACDNDEFHPEPQTKPFSRGDALLMYTDGATESRNREGKMLGITGMERLVATLGGVDPGRWTQTLLGWVDDHRFGPPADDTLIVELYRPVQVPSAGRMSTPADRAADATA